MHSEKNLSGLIENLEAFEQRLGVRLNALSAWCKSSNGHSELFVGGELHVENGNTLKHSIVVVADAYNSSNQLLATDNHQFDSDAIYCYGTFMIFVDRLPHDRIEKIRVYPKPA